MRSLLAGIQSAILERPYRALAASAALVVAAAVLGSGVEVRQSRSELAPPDDPDQQRWSELLEEYGASEAVVACVESAGPGPQPAPRLREFADRLAHALRDEPRVATVFHRLDMDWLVRHGVHLVGAERLAALDAELGPALAALDDLRGVDGLAAFDRALARRIERGLADGVALPQGGAAGAAVLASWLAWQRRLLEDPEDTIANSLGPNLLERFAPPGRRTDGYLATRDGRTLFLIVSPRDNGDALAERRRLLADLRARAAEVVLAQPGFRVAFTGQPALVVDEMDTVRADTWRTSVVAVLGVGLLTLLVFRWRSHAILVLIALAAGVLWAFGAVRLELGYLNLITSSFISTLIGLGVAYGIHPVSEYELEGAHTVDPTATVRRSFRRTGAGVAVAAITTSAAFFSIMLMRFRGFSELGLVAGVGVLLCLLAATVTLPAMLVVYGRWRHDRDRGRPRREAAAVDRLWGELLAGRICRRPRTTVALACLLTVTMLAAASGLEFDTNILGLLPRNAESLRYQQRMLLDSDLSPMHNLVVAEDLEDLGRMRARAAEEPSIERFESVLDLLPSDREAAAPILARWRAELSRLVLPRELAPPSAGSLAAALGELEQALAEASETAFAAGLGELAAALDDAREQAEASRRIALAAPPAKVERWAAAQAGLLERLRVGREELLDALGGAPPTLADLPAELRARYLTRSGKPLGFLHPAASVFDPQALDAYVAASRRVSPQATGFPLVFHKMSGRITRGFYRAVAVGAVLVTLILLLDYRNLRETLLALLPLALGVAWMLGAMRLLGLSFNFANLVAVPLILGVGIDNGVHVIHRVRLEGRAGMEVVLRHTARAILIASLTTMVGFGSLALASHRGLASLGLVLLLGVGACLVAAIVVLPNVLIVLGIAER